MSRPAFRQRTTVIRPVSASNPNGAGGELPELLTAEEVSVWLKISVKGRTERFGKCSPIQSKAGAEEFERQLRTTLLAPVRQTKKEVPTFSAYAEELLQTYVAANNKPSERSMKACILKHHLLPVFGDLQLDTIKVHAIVDAVKSDPERLALVLLGADAGLRQGESIALEWGNVDFTAGVLKVRRSSRKGVVGTTKSGRERKVPLTARLRAALKAHRHAKSELVFCHADGTPFTQSAIEAALRFGCKRAGLRRIGSHVRDARAAPKAIQDLVGHATLTMTLRYMHLAPSAFHEAIGLLEVWATSGQCPEPGGLN